MNSWLDQTAMSPRDILLGLLDLRLELICELQLILQDVIEIIPQRLLIRDR